jgi:hypothetical protein
VMRRKVCRFIFSASLSGWFLNKTLQHEESY